MSLLLKEIDRELYALAKDVERRERDGRGLLRPNPLRAVDIYAHPATMCHFKFAVSPWMIELGPREDMAPGAIGKYRNCWLIASAAEPEGAFFIRHKGEVHATIPWPAPEPSPS